MGDGAAGKGSVAWTADLRARWEDYLGRDDLEGARRLITGLPPRARVDALADGDGVTALIKSSALGRVDFCDLLLQAGADPARRDNFGRTAWAAFGSERAGDPLFSPQPPPEEGARARQLFLAAGVGEAEEQPLCHFIAPPPGADELPESPRERRRVDEFWQRLEKSLAYRRLPYPLRDPESPLRARVWLLTEEISAVMSQMHGDATAAGLTGLVALSRPEWL